MATDIKEEGQTTIQKVMDNITRSEQYDRIRAYTTEQWTKLAQRLSARREQLNKLVNDMLEQIDGKVNEMSGRSDQAEYAPQWDRIKQILRSVRNSFNYFLKPEGSGTLTVTSQVQGDGMRESSTVTITKGNGTSPITGNTAQGELRDMTASLAQLVQELDAMQALGQTKMANKSQEASRKWKLWENRKHQESSSSGVYSSKNVGILYNSFYQ